ncbi:MAG: nucleoside kinase, partial [Clostridiales bacterium]|nr:nucleoside kinase [Clostridiales bacterium]
RIRMVLIAGPSSSGKTTLARKISTQLAVFGIGSVIISMDDYYKDRDSIPVDESGNVDFEHINALKTDDFNNDLFSIISSKEVFVPKFSFEEGKAVSYRPVRLEKDSVIIIEGIHGLNESVSSLVPRMNKYKVYISALQHLSIDTHTPISSSQCRQIRRIVRDYRFRATRAERTFDMWPSVRRGEFRWIYPYQEEADYIFDSSLTYEIGVLKKYALPMLSQISRDDKHFISANELIKFLKYFRDIDDSLVPSNSILREFIGGNAYE